MEEKAKKKLTVKGLLKAFLVVLLILVILSLIIIFGGKGNKKDNAIIRGESGTKSLVVYFSQADVVDLDKIDAVSSASMRTDNSGNVYGNTESATPQKILYIVYLSKFCENEIVSVLLTK